MLGASLNILLIDDDNSTAVELRDFLHLVGHLAIWGEDGQTVPESFPCDLAIIVLPFEAEGSRPVIERVAAQRPGTSVIFICGDDIRARDLAESCAQARGLNRVGTLFKPLKLEQLAALLERFAEQLSEPGPSGEGGGSGGSQSGSRLRIVRRKGDADDPDINHVFQSRHDLRSGAIVGYEAFSRISGVNAVESWFADLDHDRSFATTISAARAAFSLHDRLGNQAPPATVAFHCPPAIFADPRFLTELNALSAVMHVPSTGIAIKITSPSTPTPSLSLTELSPIARHYASSGFQLHMGSFGMNMESLAQIVTLPLSDMKFDRDFLYDIMAADPQLLDEIISLCHLRGIRSTVMKIEGSDEFRLARQTKADFGQGYYWSRPTKSVRLHS